MTNDQTASNMNVKTRQTKMCWTGHQLGRRPALIDAPRLHNRVNSENNQSNEKDFNFSLKSVTVADEVMVLSPVSTTRVDGPNWRVTGFHYPGNGYRSPVNSGRQLG